MHEGNKGKGKTTCAGGTTIVHLAVHVALRDRVRWTRSEICANRGFGAEPRRCNIDGTPNPRGLGSDL